MGTKLYTKPNHVLVQTVDNEMILLNLESEYYFALDEIGVRFWEVLQGIDSLDQAIDTLEAEYDIDRETLRQDLDDFLRQLEGKGLLQTVEPQP